MGATRWFSVLTAVILCSVGPVRAQEARFVRADVNASGAIDISDAIFLLNFLFLGGEDLSCRDASDANDDGSLDISDPSFILNFLFAGGPAPPLPGSGESNFDVTHCGEDPTPDTLDCVAFTPCPPLPPEEVPPPPPTVTRLPRVTGESFVTVSGTAEEAETVEISGGVSVVTADVVDGAYEVVVELLRNRQNRLFVTAIAEDLRSAATPAKVIQDSTPPLLFIDFPAGGATLCDDATVIAGRVSDRLSGFMGLEVTVEGVRANVDIGIGTNGTFERAAVPLVDGANTFTVVATDLVGNTATKSVTVINECPEGGRLQIVSGNSQSAPVLGLLPEPLVARVIDSTSGEPIADRAVTFRVALSDGALSASADGSDPARRLTVRTGADGTASAFLRLGTDAGCANNRVAVTGEDVANTIFFCESADPAPADQINIGSGNNQRGEAGGPAPAPLRVWVSDSCNGVAGVPVTFSVTRGGGKVNGEDAVIVTTSETGHAEVDFVLGPRAGNNFVQATFQTNPLGPATFQIFGVRRNRARPTTFSGFVIDNGEQPIQGARCELEFPDGTVFETVTGIDGRFRFARLDRSGNSHLFIDGGTATRIGGDPGRAIPAGSFPSLSFEPFVVPNVDNALSAPVRLPRVNPLGVVYNGRSTVQLTVPDIAGLRMTVLAGTVVTLADGTVVDGVNGNSVELSLSQVHHDDIPMPMPDGAAPPFAWTFQPAGATFDPPVRITYPNMSGLPAGAISYFLSFDHDTNDFEIVATGRVAEDGSTITSDPGSGIIVSGWGCNCPPYSVAGDCENDPCERAKKDLQKACDETRGSAAAALNCQLACLAENGCTPDAPKWQRDTITDTARNRRRTGGGPAERVCRHIPSWIPTIRIGSFQFNAADVCFAIDGSFHVKDELYPSWRRNCDNIDDREHNDFLFNILVPCLLSNPDLSIWNRLIGSGVVPAVANIVREIAQANCPGSGGGGGAGLPILPPPPTEAELSVRDDITADLALSVSPDAPFFLDVGDTLQISVARGEDDITPSASGTLYFATPIADDRANDFVTISPDGLLEVRATPSPFQSLPAIAFVYVRNGDDFGMQQFAIRDVDSDGDLLVDSYETRNGLDPDTFDDPTGDADGDGIGLIDEVVLGSDPNERDSDGDGVNDGAEVKQGSDPLDPSSSTASLGAPSGVILVASGRGAGGNDDEEDDSLPQLTVGGQATTADSDGGFVVNNVVAADLFGAGGPGTVPDFLSDDRLVLRGSFVRDGVLYYVSSDCFQIRQGETFEFDELTISTEPPLAIEALRVTPSDPVLTTVGQTTQLRVFATLSDGSEVELDATDDCITYRTSNQRVADVSESGLVTARSGGQVFLTAVLEGSTAVTRLLVVVGSPLTTVTGRVEDRAGNAAAGVRVSVIDQPLSVRTGIDGRFEIPGVATDPGLVSLIASLRRGTQLLVGSADGLDPVPSGLTDAGVITLRAINLRQDSDGDGVPDDVERLTGTNPDDADSDDDGIIDGEEDADGDGLSDAGEFLLGTDPGIADSNGNGVNDGDEDADGDGLSDGEETRPGRDGVFSNPFSPDTDGDGMLDGYESRFGLNPLDASDANIDSDGDGLTNLEESRLDTDPFNPDRVPPTVESVDGLRDEEGVFINSSLDIVFSEAMRPESLNANTVQLLDPAGEVVPSTVSLGADGRSVSLDPTNNLLPSSAYTVRIAGVRDAAGNLLEREFTEEFRTSSQTDFTRPTLAQISPTNNILNAPVNSAIAIRFSEPVLRSTVDSTSLTVRNDKTFAFVTGEIGFDETGRIVCFTPDRPLSVGTRHTVRATTAITDRAANALVPFATAFTTGFREDTTPPVVLAIDPVDGAMGVPTNASVTVRVDEPLDATSISRDSIFLNRAGLPVAGTFTLFDANRRVRFVPAEPLAQGVTYTISVAGLRDRAKNVMTGTVETTFTLGEDVDRLRPFVTSVNPASGATDVPLDVVVTLTFNEPLNATTVTADSVMLQVAPFTVRVDADVSLSADRTRVEIAPRELLEPRVAYRVVADVLDTAGNSDTFGIATFITGADTDEEPPQLLSISPRDGDEGVPLNARVVVRVSEPLDIHSLGSLDVSGETSGRVAGATALSSDRRVLTFTPDENLAIDVFTVDIRGLTDVAGNRLAVTTSFSTGGLQNLSRATGSTARASSQSGNLPPDRVIDGDASTSWFTACSDAANRGATPFVEVTLPGDAEVDLVRILGNRQSPDGFDIFAGRLQAFAGDDTELFDSGVVDLPAPDRDIVITLGGVASVRRVRFTLTADESCTPGLAELQVFGRFADPALGGVVDTGRPRTIVDPPNGATDVPLDQVVTVRFTERVDETSVGYGNTVFLQRTVTFETLAVDFAMSSTDLSTEVTLTPLLPLQPETTYRILVQDPIRDAAGNRLISSVTSFSTTTGLRDTERPRVISATPPDGSLDVHFRTPVVLAFNESLAATTVNSSTLAFFINGDRRNPIIARSVDNRMVTLTGLAETDAGRPVSVVATGSILDTAGNPLEPFTMSFTLAPPSIDTRAPSVSGIRPANAATNVPIDKPVILIFTEAIDPTSAAEGIFVSENGVLVDGAIEVTAAGRVVRFQPARPFAHGALVQVFATRDVTDEAGIPLPRFEAMFMTAQDPENIALDAVQLEPRNAAPTNSTFCTRFNKPVDATTINESALRVNNLSVGGSPAVAGEFSVSGDGRTVCFDPVGTLAPNSRIRFTYTTEIRDTSGGPLRRVRIFDSVLGAEADDVAPSVTAVAPPDGSEGIGVNAIIRIRLDEPVNPLTVGESTILISSAAGNAIACSFLLLRDRSIISIAPHALLEGDTLYTVAIEGLTDAAGNRVTPSTTTFRTAADLDFERPRAVRVSPLASATGVPINARVVAVFSEPVAPETVEAASTWIRDGKTSALLEATREISADGRMITLTPAAPLSVGVRHTIQLSQMEDLSGNAFRASSSTFTTGFGPDADRPSIVLENPVGGDEGVPVNVLPSLRTDEPIDPVSLFSEGNVTLSAGGSEVPIRIMPFGADDIWIRPRVLLAPNTEHTLTLDGLQDLSGNGLAAPHVVDFRTGPDADLQRPRVVVTNPQSGETGVGTGVVVELLFDEPLSVTSVTSDTVRLIERDFGFTVDAAVELDDSRTLITLRPEQPLEPRFRYTVSAGVTDTAGNTASFFSLAFSTGDLADGGAPEVDAVSPAGGSTGVPLNARVALRFRQPLNPVTLDAIRFTGEATGDVAVRSSLSPSRLLLTLTPVVELPLDSFTVTLDGVADVDGSAVSFSSGFATSGVENLSLAAGTTAEASSEFSASNAAERVIDGNASTSWFTECGDAANRGASPFVEVILPGDATLEHVNILGNRQSAVGFDFFAGRVEAFDSTGTRVFDSDIVDLPAPHRDLVVDAGGVPGVRRVRFTGTDDESCDPGLAELQLFGTLDDAALGGHVDGVAPTAVIDPANSATDVPLDSPVVIRFSERVDHTKLVLGSSVFLQQAATGFVVAADMEIADVNGQTIVTLIPLGGMLPDTGYSASANTNVLDLAGNSIVSASSRFTTAAGEADTTRPRVLAIDPPAGTEDYPFTRPIVVTLSESINGSTVTANTAVFFLDGVRRQPSIARSLDNRVLTITGLNVNDVGRRASLVLTSGIQDLSGNGLEDFSATFTVAAAFDASVPGVQVYRPANGATGVPPDRSIVVRFSEPIDTSTAAGAVFVSENGVLVDGSLRFTGDDRVLVFTPAVPFAFSALVQIVITTDLADRAGRRMSRESSSMFMTRADPAVVNPLVNSLIPRNPPANATVFARFSKPMDPATITDTSVLVNDLSVAGGPPVAGTRSLDSTGRLFSFTPTTPPTPGNLIRFSFTTAILDTFGIPLRQNRIFDVRFGDTADEIAPRVTAVAPAGGSTGIAPNAEIRVYVDEPVNPLTVSRSTVMISDGAGEVVPCSITLSRGDTVIRVVPHDMLASSTEHTVTVDGITDLAGNPAPATSAAFTTGTALDTVHPVIRRACPESNAADVPRNVQPVIALSEDFDPASVDTESFGVVDNTTGRLVSGSHAISGRTVRFVPDDPLAPDARYSIRIAGALQDLAGNVARGFSRGFTTGADGDTAAPEIAGVHPAAGDANVPTNAAVMVDFSERICSSCVSGLTVLLNGPEGRVPATLGVLAGHRRVTITPLAPLDPGTSYTTSVSGLTDYAGNPLAAGVDATFTTGVGADLIRPVVTVLSPARNETGVPRDVSVILTFNEDLNPLSVNASTVRIDGVESTVTLDPTRRVVTITPLAMLGATQRYIVRADVLDVAGNVDNFSSSAFTTGSAP